MSQSIPALGNPLILNGGYYSVNQPSSPTSTPSNLTPPNSNLEESPGCLNSVGNGVNGNNPTIILKRDSDSTGSEPSSPSDECVPKKAGRRKIKIEFIEDKNRRHITFSKRKSGIMKKAYELSTLTGTQVLLLVASETGHVYTFATPKLQPLITRADGKNLIQSCLNTPDSVASPSNSSQSRLTYNSSTTSNNITSTSSNNINANNSPNLSLQQNMVNNNIDPMNNLQNPYNTNQDYSNLGLEMVQQQQQHQQQQVQDQQKNNLLQSPIKSEHQKQHQYQQQQQQQQQQQPQFLHNSSPNLSTIDPLLTYSQFNQLGYYQIPQRYISSNSASTSPLSPNQYGYNSHPINQFGNC